MLRKLMEDSSLSATQVGIGLTILQCIVAVPVVLAVRAPPSPKERTLENGTTLPETVANILMYGPAAAIAYWKAGFLQGASAAAASSKVPMLLLTHFGKKAMEKILLKGQTGSSPEEEIPINVAVQTSAFCSVGTYLVAAQALPVPAGIDFAQIVFWLGQLGNSFHASLLEHYKAKEGSTSRGIPDTGGLFQVGVAAPQLLFEIVAWLGIASSARTTSGYIQAGLTAIVLGYQAKRLNDAATEEETGFLSRSVGGESKPVKRWNLIPYIY